MYKLLCVRVSACVNVRMPCDGELPSACDMTTTVEGKGEFWTTCPLQGVSAVRVRACVCVRKRGREVSCASFVDMKLSYVHLRFFLRI